jgi:hypothetical protein
MVSSVEGITDQDFPVLTEVVLGLLIVVGLETGGNESNTSLL